MKLITLNKSNDLITGSIWSENFSVPYSEKRFDSMQKLYKESLQAETKTELDKVIEKFRVLTVISTQEKVESNIPDLLYNPDTDNYYLKAVVVGEKIVSSIAIPKPLINKILEANDRGFDVSPMIKFWVRLLRNPQVKGKSELVKFANLVCSYVTRTFVDKKLEAKLLAEGLGLEVATERATMQQTPFTMEGLICTKKVVDHKFDITEYEWKMVDGDKKLLRKEGTEDTVDPVTGETITVDSEFIAENQVYKPAIYDRGDNFYCGNKIGYIYMVGKEARLPSWDMVNCNSNQSCSRGLHTGNEDYINGFQCNNNTTLNCFVDPMDIGAVCDGDDVMRVLAFFPHSIKDREESNKQYYMSSHYAKITDARWAEAKIEAIEAYKVQSDNLKKFVEDEVKVIENKMKELEI